MESATLQSICKKYVWILFSVSWGQIGRAFAEALIKPSEQGLKKDFQ